MSKIYMIGKKNGRTYVAHAHPGMLWVLDDAQEITKADYRRFRAEGVPSLGEQETAAKMRKG